METKGKVTSKSNVLRELLLGSFFVSKEVNTWMPIVVLLVVLGLITISVRFRGEKVLRNLTAVQEEVKELRSESATIDARLVNMCKYSEVLKRVNKEGLGLKPAKNPPYIVKIND